MSEAKIKPNPLRRKDPLAEAVEITLTKVFGEKQGKAFGENLMYLMTEGQKKNLGTLPNDKLASVVLSLQEDKNWQAERHKKIFEHEIEMATFKELHTEGYPTANTIVPIAVAEEHRPVEIGPEDFFKFLR